jgi:P4 family phage/plasmid primase-like protien
MHNKKNSLEMGRWEMPRDLIDLQISPTFPSGGSQANGAGSSQQSSRQPIHNAQPEEKDLKYRPLDKLNDHQLALIFKEAGLSQCLRYGQEGEYYHYSGSVWERTKNKNGLWHETNRLVEFYREAERSAPSAEDRTAAEKNSAKAGNIQMFSKMLRAIQTSSDLLVQAHLLDQKDYWLNAQNCTIDLSSGDVFAHSPEHLLTQITPVVFDAKATFPLWEDFVAQTQDNDEERILHLQKAVGYSLSAYNPKNALFYLVGKPGTGKSTFMEVLMQLLGAYATLLPQSVLYTQSGDVMTKLAVLENMRIAYLPEMDHKYQISEARLKTLTGSDRYAARHLYSSQQTLKPTWKIWISANETLRIEHSDSALFRRWHPIEFAEFEGESDQELKDKLKPELSGILNWALRGFREYQKTGLALPRNSQNIHKSVKAKLDPVGAFLRTQI